MILPSSSARAAGGNLFSFICCVDGIYANGMQRDPERPSYGQKWIERLAPGYFTNMWPENTPRASTFSVWAGIRAVVSFPIPDWSFSVLWYLDFAPPAIEYPIQSSIPQLVARAKTITCGQVWASRNYHRAKSKFERHLVSIYVRFTLTALVVSAIFFFPAHYRSFDRYARSENSYFERK